MILSQLSGMRPHGALRHIRFKYKISSYVNWLMILDNNAHRNTLIRFAGTRRTQITQGPTVSPP